MAIFAVKDDSMWSSFDEETELPNTGILRSYYSWDYAIGEMKPS